MQYSIALVTKDAVTFPQDFMYDYVTFVDGKMLFKDDLVMDEAGDITAT